MSVVVFNFITEIKMCNTFMRLQLTTNPFSENDFYDEQRVYRYVYALQRQ